MWGKVDTFQFCGKCGGNFEASVRCVRSERSHGGSSKWWCQLSRVTTSAGDVSRPFSSKESTCLAVPGAGTSSYKDMDRSTSHPFTHWCQLCQMVKQWASQRANVSAMKLDFSKWLAFLLQDFKSSNWFAIVQNWLAKQKCQIDLYKAIFTTTTVSTLNVGCSCILIAWRCMTEVLCFFDIVTFQWCTGYSINECSAEVSHVLQSLTEFTANFASNFYDTWIVIWSTMADHFCLNPTLCYVHIIYPAVHGSCTDALFCHACSECHLYCNFSKNTP